MNTRIPAQCFHPGEYIRDEMEAREWDAAELAKRMSVSAEIVLSLIEYKQDITPAIAFGLHRAFGTSVDLWMNLQKAFDVWQEAAEQKTITPHGTCSQGYPFDER